jgi:hypothetical protein
MSRRRVSHSPDREERKRHGKFSLSRVRDKSEVRDSVRTVLPSLAGRLIGNQGVRKLSGGESAQDNERHSEFRRPAMQTGRDRALEFQ